MSSDIFATKIPLEGTVRRRRKQDDNAGSENNLQWSKLNQEYVINVSYVKWPKEASVLLKVSESENEIMKKNIVWIECGSRRQIDPCSSSSPVPSVSAVTPDVHSVLDRKCNLWDINMGLKLLCYQLEESFFLQSGPNTGKTRRQWQES